MRITVRSTHLDRFNHVNNAKFLEFFEWARWEWAEQHGWDFEQLIKQGLDPAVVHVSIDYFHELKFKDSVIIKTHVQQIGNKSITLIQEMKKNELIVSRAKVIVVLVNRLNKKSIKIPNWLRELLQEGKK